jgi:hypothetical protein
LSRPEPFRVCCWTIFGEEGRRHPFGIEAVPIMDRQRGEVGVGVCLRIVSTNISSMKEEVDEGIHRHGTHSTTEGNPSWELSPLVSGTVRVKDFGGVSVPMRIVTAPTKGIEL